jgi:predicted dehydrogenase
MKESPGRLALVSVVAEPAGLLSNPDIDLIVIATPNDSHFPLAKAALEAGKHVVVDKPFTVTLSQARSWRPWPGAAADCCPFFITAAGIAIF